MEVKPGYKRTEIGLIPEDWDVKKVGDICDFIVPGRNRPRDFQGEIPWITTPDLADGQGVSKSRIGLCISRNEAKNVGSRVVPAGSVLMSCAGELGIVALTEREIVINQQLHAFIPPQTIDGRYLLNAIKAQKKHIDALATKTAVPYLNKDNCNSIPIALPRLFEQRAIAEALSDVDALIGVLDQLIAKKRDLKQAAMQQLLTGQKRLPGFHGEWEVKRLGDVIEKLVGGGTPSRAIPAFWGKEIPWVTVKDFATFHPRHTQEFITKEGLNQSASHLIPAGTLITSTRMALGKAVIYEVDVAINQDLKALFLRPNASVWFLNYWFEYHARMIDELGSGSTVKGISVTDLRGIPFLLASLTEQTAIAEVLSDMDAELTALEQRREKTRALKQGMMQELLTGRTRLV